MEHLADGRFQEGDAAGMARAVPGIRSVLGIVHQGAEKRRSQSVEIGFRLTDDVPRHEFRCVLEHVDETVQLTQQIVRNVAGCTRFTIKVDRNVGVLAPDFRHEGAQGFQGFVDFLFRPFAEFLVVDGQDKSGCAGLLLRKLRKVTIAGDAQYFHSFIFHRFCQRTDTQPGRVFGTIVFVDDDDRKAKFHRSLQVCTVGNGRMHPFVLPRFFEDFLMPEI